MKKVKQTLKHLVLKKSDTRRAYFTFKIPVCVCLEPLTRLRSLNSLSGKKTLPSSASNSQNTTNMQQRAHDNQQSLTQLCIENTNLSNTFAHISVEKAT